MASDGPIGEGTGVRWGLGAFFSFDMLIPLGYPYALLYMAYGNVGGARSIEFQWYTGYAGMDPDQMFQFSILYEEGVIGVFVYRYYQMFAVSNPAFVTVAGSPPQDREYPCLCLVQR